MPRVSRSEQENEECVHRVDRAIRLLRCRTSHGRHEISPGSLGRVPDVLRRRRAAPAAPSGNEQCVSDATHNPQLAQVYMNAAGPLTPINPRAELPETSGQRTHTSQSAEDGQAGANARTRVQCSSRARHSHNHELDDQRRTVAPGHLVALGNHVPHTGSAQPVRRPWQAARAPPSDRPAHALRPDGSGLRPYAGPAGPTRRTLSLGLVTAFGANLVPNLAVLQGPSPSIGPGRDPPAVPYAGWVAFGTALNAAMARRNPEGHR